MGGDCNTGEVMSTIGGDVNYIGAMVTMGGLTVTMGLCGNTKEPKKQLCLCIFKIFLYLQYELTKKKYLTVIIIPTFLSSSYFTEVPK